MSANIQALAKAIGVEPSELKSAAEAVGETPEQFARIAVEFRRNSINPEEFRQYVDEVAL